MSPEQMAHALLQWNPKWNPETVNRWSYGQLRAVYMKELDKRNRSMRKMG